MRVAVFVCHYSIGASPAIINTCLSLSEHGIGVDIYSYNNAFNEYVSFSGEDIHLFDLSHDSGEGSELERTVALGKKFLGTILPEGMGRFLGRYSLEYRLKRHGVSAILPTSVINKTKQMLGKQKYAAFFGVESAGLVWAGLLGGGENVPLIYLSLELYLRSDKRFQGPYYEMLRTYEEAFHRKTVATIIQDQERGALLAAQNGVSLSGFMVVPVSIKGEPVTEKDPYLHDHLGIPADRQILLCIGGINKFRLSLETAMTADSLPDGWVMVLHGWPDHKGYLKTVRALKGDKLYVSTALLPFDQVSMLVSSAHVGISFYSKSGYNEELIASASGKLAHYFQCGLPVIANDIGNVRKVIDYYRCGVCVTSPSEIPGALHTITREYDEMRRNAFACYREKYEITSHFSKVINLLKKLEAHG